MNTLFFRSLSCLTLAGLLLAGGVSAAPTAQAADPEPGQRIAVPAYIPPSDTASWASLTSADSRLGFIVANPASGPGTAVDAPWKARIDEAHGQGTKVLGYVDSGYFGQSSPPRRTETGATDVASWARQAERDVDRWYTLYGGSVDGIFVDDGLNTCGPTAGDNSYAQLYIELNDYIHSNHGGSLTVVNPGILVPQCYQAAADVLVTFEGTLDSYLASSPPEWQVTSGTPRFWDIVYGVGETQLAAVSARSKQNNAGFLYATPDTLPNPYDTAPTGSYWQAELAGVSGASATGGIDSTRVSLSESTATFAARFGASWNFEDAFIDTDSSPATGYGVGGIGAEFLLEGDSLYRYSGDGTSFSWTPVDGALVSAETDVTRWDVPLATLGTPSTLRVVFAGSGGAADAVSDVVVATR